VLGFGLASAPAELGEGSGMTVGRLLLLVFGVADGDGAFEDEKAVDSCVPVRSVDVGLHGAYAGLEMRHLLAWSIDESMRQGRGERTRETQSARGRRCEERRLLSRVLSSLCDFGWVYAR
jgi:hypothetical protein